MNPKIMETLEKQLQLLSERSQMEINQDAHSLEVLSASMCEIVRTLNSCQGLCR